MKFKSVSILLVTLGLLLVGCGAGKTTTSNADWTPQIEEINGVLMAQVPAGCFQMSSAETYSASTVHEVCFEEPFWIDVYEVTNAYYGGITVACMAASAQPDQPHVCIYWADALAHCQERGARLPTEAEWEYALRGPDGWKFPWGNDFIADNVVYAGNALSTWAVGSKPNDVSWVGAHDLAGNVREWVNDWYASYTTSPQVNPQGPETGEYRVVRGGSWHDYDGNMNMSATIRDHPVPTYGADYIGFRCALSNQQE